MGLLNIKARTQGIRLVSPKAHWIMPYMAIPFKDRGRTRQGADCWGWVRIVFADLQPQIDLPAHDTISAYDTVEVNKAIAHESSKEHNGTPLWSPVRRQDIRPFDLVVMMAYYDDENGRTRRAEGHVAIAVDRMYVVHMEDHKGVIKSRLDDGNVSRRIVSIWRHRDIRPVQQ